MPEGKSVSLSLRALRKQGKAIQSPRGRPASVIARFRKEPRQSCLRGEGTSPSLRGSARNRGNPVSAGKARPRHCEVPQGTAAIRSLFLLSLRGSARNRGNPVSAGKARPRHCEVPQGTVAIQSPRGGRVTVIARFRKEPRQSWLRGEGTSPSLRGSARNRGNPFFVVTVSWSRREE